MLEKNSSDPFVVAKFKGFGKMMNSVQTSVIHNTLNPCWNQELCLYPKNATDVLLLKVYDHDTLSKDNLLGMVEIPLERFFQQGFQDHWIQLMGRKGSWKSLVGGHPTWYAVPGQLHIQLWFGLSSQIQSTGQAPPQITPVVMGSQFGQPTQQQQPNGNACGYGSSYATTGLVNSKECQTFQCGFNPVTNPKTFNTSGGFQQPQQLQQPQQFNQPTTTGQTF